MRFCAVLFLTLAAGFAPAAQPPKEKPSADEEAILKNAETFLAAFHKGDAKAVAALWTADGDYTDTLGKRQAGRDAIQKGFAAFFAENKGAKLRIDIDSIKFITPEVAIEDGVTAVSVADGGPPSRAKYTIVHVKKDGKWSIGSVRETVYTPPSNYEHLKGLEGLVGSWAEDGAKGETVRISFEWAMSQNFLMSSYHVNFKNISVGGATQFIGWDAAAKSIRSWSFHAHGGFGEGTWTQDGKAWTIKTTATHPDGKKTTATDTITFVDAETVKFSAKDRTLDGKPLPDIKEVTLKRVK